MKMYTLKVRLFYDKKISRTIEATEDTTLYNLAKVVVRAYDFDFDHAFGFYSNLKNEYYQDSEKQYELFADMPGGESTAGSVKKTTISQVWKNSGDRMLFLFDYGDMRRFFVELMSIEEKDGNKKYPRIVEKIGASPEQYPALDDEEYTELRDENDEDIFEAVTLVKTEAGVKDGKFRYWAVLICMQGKKFTKDRKGKLKGSFLPFLKDHTVEVENISYGAGYALCTILVSPKRAVGKVLDTVILLCNVEEPFLRSEYIVTNVTKPTKRDTTRFL